VRLRRILQRLTEDLALDGLARATAATDPKDASAFSEDLDIPAPTADARAATSRNSPIA
jgi:hypothetical protein